MSDDSKHLCLPENPDWVPNERNIGEFILKHMKLNKHKIAQIDAQTGKTMTYEIMLARCIALAKEMKKHGLVADDIVSVCSRNCLENNLPVLASYLLGIKSASLDPSLSLSDTIHLLNLTNPRMIFCDSESLDLIESAIEKTKLNTKIVVFGDTDKHLSFNSFASDNEKIDDSYQVESNQTIEDIAVILFSSGSTGLPKGICISNYGILYQLNMLNILRLKDVNIFINFATTYWISTTVTILVAIVKGATRVICPKFEAAKCLEYVEKYKIDFMALSATTFLAFIQNPELCNKYDHSSLKLIGISGGRLCDEHLNKFKLLFPIPPIINGYGMTEISGCAVHFDCKIDRNLLLHKGVSCGRPLPGIFLKVLDLHTQKPVGPNKTGELRIKTKTVMKSYLGNAMEYEKQFDEEGYFITGDIVYYDEDYCFYVVDRLKDMFKFQSWHVTPASIESVLLTHPNIQEAIVTGIPHKTDGEHPLAVIVLKSNSSVTSDDIIQYVAERVSDRQRLRGGVKFVTELLRTPTGKLRRLELRQMIINGKI